MPIASTINDFYLSADALSFILNLRGNPDDLSISVYSGAKVVAYHKDIIEYDPAMNYKQWTVSAFPTHFDDHVARYAHIALSRDGSNALVVFPTTRLDLLGRATTDDGSAFIDAETITDIDLETGAETETVVEPTEDPDHYYLYLGKISSSGADGRTMREWLDGPLRGVLDTDQYRNEQASTELEKMFSLSQLKEYIIQHLPFRSIFIGRNVESQKEINDVQRSTDNLPPSDTVIPTTAFTDHEYLSKTKKSQQSVVSDVNFAGGVSVGNDLVVKSDIDAQGNVSVSGSVASKPFETGPLGTGWKFDAGGNGEVESLRIRRFLEVPELRYNKISVRTGVQWQTFGAGLIEAVKPLSATTGIIKLKLEEGEYGAVAVDDLAMGIYHNETSPGENAPSSEDSHDGNFLFAGFMTIYFRVEAICDEHGDTSKPDPKNQYFIYELRAASDATWTDAHHPEPSMSFACYANQNPSKTTRQACKYTTDDYEIYLENMTAWTYGPDNIYIIIGLLDGFSVWALNDVGQRYLKQFYGKGAYLGRIYSYAPIDQFTRLADHINLTALPLINSDFTIADGETMTLTAQMVSYDDQPRRDVTYSITRHSSDEASDAAWNIARGADIASGSMTFSTVDLMTSGGGYDQAVEFSVSATRLLPTDEGGEEYTIVRTFVMRNAGGYKLVDDLGFDIFIDHNEEKTITFDVESPRGGSKATELVTSWSVTRGSGDEAADLTWNNSPKALAFRNRTLPHVLTIEQADLSQVRDYTTLLVTAYFGSVPVAQTEYTI